MHTIPYMEDPVPVYKSVMQGSYRVQGARGRPHSVSSPIPLEDQPCSMYSADIRMAGHIHLFPTAQ
jgi:hypothetical protein